MMGMKVHPIRSPGRSMVDETSYHPYLKGVLYEIAS